jgi:hypothetical protein
MFFSVVAGCKVGIFLVDYDCMNAVKYKKGAAYKKVDTLQEAVEHQNKHGFKHYLIRVHVLGLSTRLHDYCVQHGEPEIPAADCELGTCFTFGYDINVNIKIINGDVVLEFAQEDNTLALRKDQWYMFRAFTELFERALERSVNREPVEVFQHLGNYIFIELKSPLLVFDIRRYYPYENRCLRQDQRAAISFRVSEWRHLLNISNQIENVLQDVSCGLNGTIM